MASQSPRINSAPPNRRDASSFASITANGRIRRIKGRNVLRFAQQRLLLNAALDEYHITVTPEAAARYIKQLLGIKPTESCLRKDMETLGKLAKEGIARPLMTSTGLPAIKPDRNTWLHWWA